MAKPSELEFLKQALKDPTVHVAVGLVKTIEILADKSLVRGQIELFPDKRIIVARFTWGSATSGAGIFSIPDVGDLVLLNFLTDENSLGDVDQAYVVARLSSKEDFVPEYAHDGSLILRSKPGKKAWLTSDLRLNLSKSEIEPTENLVLGQVFKTYESTLLEKLGELDTTLSNLSQALADQAALLAEVAQTLSDMSTSLASHTHEETGTTTSVPSDAALHSTNAATFADNSMDFSDTEAEILAYKDEIDDNAMDLADLKASPIDDELILSDLAFTEKGD